MEQRLIHVKQEQPFSRFHYDLDSFSLVYLDVSIFSLKACHIFERLDVLAHKIVLSVVTVVTLLICLVLVDWFVLNGHLCVSR